jgi:hypothetical protein
MKGERMNQIQSQKRDYESIAWGAIFIWWGITELIPTLPIGLGMLGVGLILLGLNAARAHGGLQTSFFSTALGILAVVWGGLELAGLVLKLPLELPIFAILLIVLGGMILARFWVRTQTA